MCHEVALQTERLYFVRSKNSFEINGVSRGRFGDVVLAASEALSSQLMSHVGSVLPSPDGWPLNSLKINSLDEKANDSFIGS